MSDSMENEKKTLVPKLRFSEFRDAGGWASVSMGDLYCFHPTNTYSRDKLNYAEGQVKNIHYGDIHTKFATLFDVRRERVPFVNSAESIERIRPESYCVEGDIVFADASEDIEDVGKSIEIINTNSEKILAGLHTLLARQLGNKLIISFGGYLFKSDAIRKQIQKEAQGAKVLGISSGRLSGIKVCFPSIKAEQQKITDCLFSLDALIDAQANKLDSLKTHKKGLMQKLFPRESETVPRLRFPEFRDTGKWEEKKLGDIVNFVSGGTPPKKNLDYWNGNIPWISASSMHDICIDSSDHSVTQMAIDDGARLIQSGTLLLLVRGSMLHNRIPICMTKCDVTFNQDVKALSLKIKIHEGFLLYLLVSCESRLLNIVTKTGIGAGKLDTNDLNDFLVCFPNKKCEQKIIADSLFSLDELITVYTEKLDTLKAHKKGLMQQLFPSPEAAGA